MLRYLLSLGVPPDVPDILGYTALTHACMVYPGPGRPDLARILLEYGANVNHQDICGIVPLTGACWTNATDTVNVLMEYGAALDIADADGCTPEDLLFIRTSPQVTATILKWKRRRNGEVAAMDEQKCAWCGRGDVDLKGCKQCYSIRYCSKTCQREYYHGLFCYLKAG